MRQAMAIALPQSAFGAGSTLAVLPTFDLTEVMARVARENPSWSADRLAKAEEDYRGFVAWARSTRGIPHTPTRDVDEVWHAHILYTKKYMEDCDAYFGFYFHHRPLSMAEMGASDDLARARGTEVSADCGDISSCLEGTSCADHD